MNLAIQSNHRYFDERVMDIAGQRLTGRQMARQLALKALHKSIGEKNYRRVKRAVKGKG
jgi:hypothetical protein